MFPSLGWMMVLSLNLPVFGVQENWRKSHLPLAPEKPRA